LRRAICSLSISSMMFMVYSCRDPVEPEAFRLAVVS
jgi:hypothetical protein